MPPSNRSAILEGAIECVQTLGVSATTTRDIAAAAGGSLASIPYHFGSKDELMTEALLTAMVRFTDRIEEVAVSSAGDGPPSVARLMAVLLDSMEQSRPLLVSMMEGQVHALHAPALKERVAEHRRQLVERIGLLVRLTLGEHARDADVRTLSILALSLIDGLFMHWLMDPDDLPPRSELVRSLGEDAPRLFATD